MTGSLAVLTEADDSWLRLKRATKCSDKGLKWRNAGPRREKKIAAPGRGPTKRRLCSLTVPDERRQAATSSRGSLLHAVALLRHERTSALLNARKEMWRSLTGGPASTIYVHKKVLSQRTSRLERHFAPWPDGGKSASRGSICNRAETLPCGTRGAGGCGMRRAPWSS